MLTRRWIKGKFDVIIESETDEANNSLKWQTRLFEQLIHTIHM